VVEARECRRHRGAITSAQRVPKVWRGAQRVPDLRKEGRGRQQLAAEASSAQMARGAVGEQRDAKVAYAPRGCASAANAISTRVSVDRFSRERGASRPSRKVGLARPCPRALARAEAKFI